MRGAVTVYDTARIQLLIFLSLDGTSSGRLEIYCTARLDAGKLPLH